VFVKLVKWEYGSQAIADTRKQDEYNQAIRGAQLCFFLFFTRAGQYTLEEFEAALAAFKQTGSPKIVTYFREVPEGSTVGEELAAFQRRLDEQVGHFWSRYGVIDTVKLGIVMQMKLGGADVPVTIEDDRALVAGTPLVDLRKVPSYQGYEAIHALEAQIADNRAEFDRLRPLFLASPDDPELFRTFAATASRRQGLLDQLAAAQQDFLDLTRVVAQRSASGHRLLPQQVQAYALFEAGHVAEALAILNLDKLREERQRAQTRADAQVKAAAEERRKEMQQYADAALDCYRMLRSQPLSPETVAQMEAALREACQVELANGLAPAAVLLLAIFLADHQGRPEAIGLYERLRDTPQFRDDERFRFRVLNNLGFLYSALHRYDQAEAALVESIAMRRRRAEVDGGAHEPGLALSLSNLGDLYRTMHRFDQAQAAHLEATRIRRALAEADPAANEPSLVASLINMGRLDSDLRRSDQAEAALLEAVSISRRLAQGDPAAHEPALALSLNNLGNLCRAMGRLDQAESAHLECSDIYRRLAQADPAAHEPNVAMSLSNLGNLYRALHRFDQAEAAQLEAVGIRRRLVRADRAVYEPDLAESLNNLGNLYAVLRRYDQAEAAHLEAAGIRRRLAEADPVAHEPDLAVSLYNLGLLCRALRRFDEAEAALLEAAAIRRRLAQSDPPAHEPSLAMSLYELGKLYHDARRFDEAEAVYLDAVDIRWRLADADPAAHEPGLAEAWNNLGVLYRAMRCHEPAEAALLEAVGIRHRLAEVDPGTYDPDLALSLNNLGNLYRDLHRFDQAEAALLEAVGIRRRLAEVDPRAYEPVLALSLNDLGTLFGTVGRFGEAEAAFADAVAIRRRLVEASPARATDLAWSLAKLGEAQKRLGKPAEAAASRAELVALLESASPEVRPNVQKALDWLDP